MKDCETCKNCEWQTTKTGYKDRVVKIPFCVIYNKEIDDPIRAEKCKQYIQKGK